MLLQRPRFAWANADRTTNVQASAHHEQLLQARRREFVPSQVLGKIARERTPPIFESQGVPIFMINTDWPMVCLGLGQLGEPNVHGGLHGERRLEKHSLPTLRSHQNGVHGAILKSSQLRDPLRSFDVDNWPPHLNRGEIVRAALC